MTYDQEDYDHSNSFSGILTYALWGQSMLIDHIIGGCITQGLEI